jgi:hypothetical protein
MLQAMLAHGSPDSTAPVEHRTLLIKPDQPRAIDRYIDYFGEGRTASHDRGFRVIRLRDRAETPSGD